MMPNIDIADDIKASAMDKFSCDFYCYLCRTTSSASMKKAYKYRGGMGTSGKDGKSIFERDVDTIVNNQIYLPTKYELNDPAEGFFDDSAITILLEQLKEYSSEVKRSYKKLLDKFDHTGIYSLSKRNDDELLWAYYASGHTGFAIEYDTDRLKESLNHNRYFQFIFDLEVDYVENIPKVDISVLYGDKATDDILRTYLGSKSISWAHEKEYRLIVEGKGLFDIDYRALTGIYFGCRMQEQEIDSIMEKLKGRGLNYYQMELIGGKYKLQPQKVEDKYLSAPKYYANSIEYDVDDLLASGGMSNENMESYRDKFITALESIKNDPLIKRFYIATLNPNSKEPILVIYADTKSGVPSTKEFNFRLNDKGEVYQVK